jgi:hypothetical protein
MIINEKTYETRCLNNKCDNSIDLETICYCQSCAEKIKRWNDHLKLLGHKQELVLEYHDVDGEHRINLRNVSSFFIGVVSPEDEDPPTDRSDEDLRKDWKRLWENEMERTHED